MSSKRLAKTDVVFNIFNYTLMVIMSVLFIFPFWQTLVISFSSPELAGKLGLKILPDSICFTSYKEVFSSGVIFTGYFNTIFRTALGTVITLLVTFCGAYSLSKKNVPFRNVITLFILFTMFFAGGLIPNYLLVRELNMINTIWALVLPGATSAWFLIITRNFISSLPDSLEEAAFIDGAHPIAVVFKIVLPLSMPIIAVIGLWAAVGHWNAWFDAMIYIQDKNKMVLQLILRKIIIDNSQEVLDSANILTQTTAQTTPETVKAATIILTIAPIILTYPFLQKYFVKGIMVGALKG